MTDTTSSADLTDGDDAPDGVDLNRTPLSNNPSNPSEYVPGSLRVDLSGNPVDRGPYFPDSSDPALDGGRVLYHMAFGAKPEDFHPALQPMARGYGIGFQPQPALGPGLLDTFDDIKAATPAQPTDEDEVVAPPPAQPLDLDTTIPDLHISTPSAPPGPLGLQDVDGLPLEQGQHSIPQFDGLIADKVRSFFQAMGDQGVPAKLRSGLRSGANQARQTGNKNGGVKSGNSLHEAGLAFDLNWDKLSPDEKAKVLSTAKGLGFSWGGTFRNPPDAEHFYVDPFDSLATRQAYIRQLQQTQGQ